MKRNNKNSDSELVFSTGVEGNSFFDHINLEKTESNESLSTPRKEVKTMAVRVQLDRKKRKGKDVTLVTGLNIYEEELSDLCKEIKKTCGTGGSIKNGEILIQGDFVKKVIEFLRDNGFNNTKRIGG